MLDELGMKAVDCSELLFVLWTTSEVLSVFSELCIGAFDGISAVVSEFDITGFWLSVWVSPLELFISPVDND